MLEHGHVLREELRSVLDVGKPWTNFSWAFQVLVAAVYALGGYWALFLLKMSVWAGIVSAVIWITPIRRLWHIPAFATILILAAFTLPNYMSLRPHLVAGLCLAGILVLMRCPLRFRTLVAWAFVLVIWANVHASVVVGCAAFGVHLLGEWWRRGYSFSEILRKSLLLAPVALIPFLTPNGTDVVRVLWDHATGSLARSYILEWGGTAMLPPLAVLVTLATLAFLLRFRCFSLGEVFLFGFFFAFALESHRFQFEMTLVAIRPASVTLFSLLNAAGDPRTRFWAAIVLALSSMIGIATYRGVSAYKLAEFPVRWELYPTSSAQVLDIAAGRLGRPITVLNHYEFGGYLQWVGAGRIRTFIDGRTPTIYSDMRLMEDVFAIAKRDLRRRVADEYDLDAIVLRRTAGLGFPLDDKQWAMVAVDSASQLYLRRGLAKSLGLAAFDYDPGVLVTTSDLAKRPEQQVALKFLVANDSVNFVAWMQLGVQQSQFEETRAASIEALSKAVALRPDSALARVLLGQQMLLAGVSEERIFRVVRPAVSNSIDDLNVHRLQNLAELLLSIHRPAEAVTVLSASDPEKKYRLDTHYLTWVQRGVAQVALGDEEAAAFSLRVASKLLPENDEGATQSAAALRLLLKKSTR